MNNGDQREIFNVKGMAEAARRTEYESIESAASEIVDNAVEANADDIRVIITSKHNRKTGRKEIEHIGFLDNGDGMDVETLHGALVYGETTRRESRGIGRFGVGLGQASLFAAPRVEVYSWQNNEAPLFVYLDSEKMKTGEQTYLERPYTKNFPDVFYRYQHEKYRSGSLIIWKNVDQSPVKTVTHLINRLEQTLGRIFRYYITESSQYKAPRTIKIIDDEQPAAFTKVKPRDPLFLLEDNFALAPTDSKKLGEVDQTGQGEPIFEPYAPKGLEGHTITKEIDYLNRNNVWDKAPVTIKFSIVKNRYYGEYKKNTNKNPGSSAIGKVVKDFEGISILRANREIDFGRFGFYDVVNKPTHRWWGVEICFDRRLDDVFKVSSNKQHVELKKPNKGEREEAHQKNIKPLWETLEEIITPAINEMVKKNQRRVSSEQKTASNKIKRGEFERSSQNQNIRSTNQNPEHKSYPPRNNSWGKAKTHEAPSKSQPSTSTSTYKIGETLSDYVMSLTSTENDDHRIGEYAVVQSLENGDVLDFYLQEGYAEAVLNKDLLSEIVENEKSGEDPLFKIFLQAMSNQYYKQYRDPVFQDYLDDFIEELNNIIFYKLNKEN